MSSTQDRSLQCVAVCYVGPYKLIGGMAYLEVTIQLIDGSELSYLVSRTE